MRVCGCVVVWLWLCGCVVVWLCGCMVVWLLVAVVRVRLGRGCGGGDELCAVDVESEVDAEDELDCVW